MIDKELLGRAHGALGVLRDTDPGAGVLRELLAAVEDTWPVSEGAVGVVVSPGGLPALVYVGVDRRVVLSDPELDLESPSRVELRVMLALVDHAREALAEVLDRTL